jgi:hypothetical protein
MGFDRQFSRFQPLTPVLSQSVRRKVTNTGSSVSVHQGTQFGRKYGHQKYLSLSVTISGIPFYNQKFIKKKKLSLIKFTVTLQRKMKENP